MNILFVTGSYYPNIGGVAKVVTETARRLCLRGHTCRVVTLRKDAVTRGEFQDEGVTVFAAPPTWERHLGGLSFGFAGFLRSNSYLVRDADIVHVHGYHTLLSLEAMILVCGKPVVFTAHHGLGHSPYSDMLHVVYKPIGRMMFETARAVIFVSEFEKGLIERRFGTMSRSRIIPHGVTDVPFPAGITKHVESVRPRLLYVGLLKEYKGVQHILSAMRELIDGFRMEPTLRIVGSGPYESRLRTIAHDLGLKDAVDWLGDLRGRELEDTYAASDLLLLPSRVEGYGIVVAEALAHGIPCIVSSSSALGEFTDIPGCYGVGNPSDVRKLAATVALLAGTDVQVGPVLGAKIRTWDQVAVDHENVYKEVLHEGAIDK
jgi:1,2-diacylglycerol 3-alpha-glucosyltransferase